MKCYPLSSWVFAFLLCLTAACTAPEPSSNPQNILFILTDEQRYDTSEPYGNTLIQTPHLNQLGRESWVFERAYVAQPVCSPARASLLTGLYPHATGVTTNNIPLPETLQTLPELLDSSYATAYIGKWHLGRELDAWQGFDERISTEDGYTASDTTRFSDYHHWLIDKGYEPDQSRSKSFSRSFCNRLPYEHTKSKFMEQQALNFLETHQKEPFLLYLGFLEPHTPNFGPFDDLHDPALVELDSTYGAFVPEEEPLRHTLIRNNERQLVDRQRLKEEMAKYWGLVHQVDRSVGAILDKLKELGLEKNTLVVFTSEHGKMMGKFGVQPKRMMYEASSRVPFMLKAPQAAVGPRKVSTPVSQIDLLPTLLDLLGKEAPEGLHGQSLLPLLAGTQPPRPVFLQWHPNSNQDERYPECEAPEEVCHLAKQQRIRTVVTPDGWKLNLSLEGHDRSQLFYLPEDPLEVNNLFYLPAYQPTVDSLTSLIEAWRVRVGDE